MCLRGCHAFRCMILSSNQFVREVQDRIATCCPRALALVALAVSSTAADGPCTTRPVTAVVENGLAKPKHPRQTKKPVMRNAIGAPSRQQQQHWLQ